MHACDSLVDCARINSRKRLTLNESKIGSGELTVCVCVYRVGFLDGFLNLTSLVWLISLIGLSSDLKFLVEDSTVIAQGFRSCGCNGAPFSLSMDQWGVT